MFESDAVSIHGVWVCLNSPPEKGQQRLEAWDPRLEVRPGGAAPAPPVVNYRPNAQPWEQPEDAPPQIESRVSAAELSALNLSELHCPPPPRQAPPPAVGLRLSPVNQAPGIVHVSASEDEDPVPRMRPKAGPKPPSDPPPPELLLQGRHDLEAEERARLTRRLRRPRSPVEPPPGLRRSRESDPEAEEHPPPLDDDNGQKPRGQWNRRVALHSGSASFAQSSGSETQWSMVPGSVTGQPAAAGPGGADPGHVRLQPGPGAGSHHGTRSLRDATLKVVSYGINHRDAKNFVPDIHVNLTQLARQYGFKRIPTGGGPMSSGLNPAVRAQVACNLEFQSLLRQAMDTIRCLALERANGPRPEVRLAVCCNWGKHRSVSFVEELAERMVAHMKVVVVHLERSHWDRDAQAQRDPDWHCTCVLHLEASGTRR